MPRIFKPDSIITENRPAGAKPSANSHMVQANVSPSNRLRTLTPAGCAGPGPRAKAD